MNVNAGTVGEVVPGSGLNYYPQITTTSSTTSPHLGYSANFGYFGETVHTYIEGTPDKTNPALSSALSGSRLGTLNGRGGDASIYPRSLTTSVLKTHYYDFINANAANGIQINPWNDVLVTTNSERSGSNQFATFAINREKDATNTSGVTIANDYAVKSTMGETFTNAGYTQSGKPFEYKIDGDTDVFDKTAGLFANRDLGSWYDGAPTIHVTPTSIKQHINTSGTLMNPTTESMALVLRAAYYPAGHASATSYTGVTTPTMSSYTFDLRDAELLTEPGFYYITQNSQEVNFSNNFNYTLSPVVDTVQDNAKVDGKRGKGKEWVMIEE
jgi:hypothetical protein